MSKEDTLKYAMAVIAHPRQPQTLATTLDSIFLAGWVRVHVFANPGVEEFQAQSGTTVARHDNAARLWPYPNFLNAVRQLLLIDPEADAYGVIQDDVSLARGLRSWVDDTFWPLLSNPKLGNRFGVVSLFTPEKLHQPPSMLGGQHGWHIMPDTEVQAWGAQAYLFSSASLRIFLSSKFVTTDLTQVDRLVLSWCRQDGYDYWMHSPSVSQHAAADQSSFGNFPSEEVKQHCLPYRKAKYFVDDVIELRKAFK